MAGVDLFFGPMLIGVLLNMVLYGVRHSSLYWTPCYRSNETPGYGYTDMLYLFIVGTANVVIECGIIYEPLIIQYGTAVTPVTRIPKHAILISTVSAPIQLFAAWRISVITESFIVPGLIASLSLGSFGSGINMSIKVVMNREFDRFETSAIVWLALSAVCDIVIAAGLSHALYTRKTGFTHVDGQINRIIRLTLETGSLTAITALADVWLFLVFPGTALNFIVDFPLASLYTVSLLAIRKPVQDEEQTTSAPMFTRPDYSQAQSFYRCRFESLTSTEKSVATDIGETLRHFSKGLSLRTGIRTGITGHLYPQNTVRKFLEPHCLVGH
ncbi:hypothetical protein B0H13DRAFT_1945959 [Mycena leptocephala]|nr:hypothetical protein B0H13DRAFT_1945959 [Mycena leptocephala]